MVEDSVIRLTDHLHLLEGVFFVSNFEGRLELLKFLKTGIEDFRS